MGGLTSLILLATPQTAMTADAWSFKVFFDGAALGTPVAIPAALVIAVGFCLQTTEASGVERSETPAAMLHTPDYVGSESCSTCHADQVAARRDSHHGWALRAADEVNVLGDFEDSTFDHAGAKNRFFRRGGKAFVETERPDAVLVEYEIKYTVGIEPFQQYLVELDRGRLQVLDVDGAPITKLRIFRCEITFLLFFQPCNFRSL